MSTDDDSVVNVKVRTDADDTYWQFKPQLVLVTDQFYLLLFDGKRNRLFHPSMVLDVSFEQAKPSSMAEMYDKIGTLNGRDMLASDPMPGVLLY